MILTISYQEFKSLVECEAVYVYVRLGLPSLESTRIHLVECPGQKGLKIENANIQSALLLIV